MLGTLAALLSAQGLPPLPETSAIRDIPDFAELLPYRPRGVEATTETSVPLLYRGDRVLNGPEGWTIERGALQSQDMLLLADHIQYNPETNMLLAEGNIRLEAQGIRLRCERLKMDWKQRAGEAWALELEISPDWTLRSDQVAFASLKQWDFRKVEVSSCPQVKPGWSMTLSRLNLNLDRFATFHNAKLFVGPVPVLYLPWGTYPAKAKRSPGLLPTLPSYSNVLGLTLGVPYFQPLGDSMDVTLDPVFYGKENPLLGSEFRWNPEPTHAGTFLGHFIHQRTDGERRYRYQFNDLWQREDGWQFTADINQASDSLLDADYGQSVGTLGSTSFDSALYLGKNFPLASLSFNVAEQRSFFASQGDPFFASGFPNSLRKQTFPELQSRMYPIELGSLYLDAGAKGSRLAYRLEFDNAPTTTYAWNREDFFTRLQGRLGQWGPFRADLQTLARFTHYGASLHAPLYDSKDAVNGSTLNPTFSPFVVDGQSIQRLLGSAKLQFSGPQLGRTYEHFSLFGYKGEMRHVLEPFFGFIQTSSTSIDALVPRFDDIDSRPGVAGSAMGEQSTEIGVTQHFFGRRGPGATFADLVRWKISTKFYTKPILLSDGTFKRGWAPIDSVFDAEPNDRLRISFRSSSDVAANTTDNSLSLELKTKEENRFSLAIFSMGIDRFLVRQRGLQIGGLHRLWDDRLRLEFHANFDYHKITSAEAALAFMTPCVATSVRYSHLALDTTTSLSKEDRVDFLISLRALGNFKLFSR